MATRHRFAVVDGLSVFYREAGDAHSPKLLLLGGFPASSHQFRNLIPALADRFHVISPDYPGFGNTDMPDPAEFAYTFDRLSEIVEGLLETIGFTGPMGIYMQDYGGPVGNRIIARHPDWLEWQVIQNANAYEEGFTAVWDAFRHALWVNRGPETEAPLVAFLELSGVKLIYTHGHGDLELDQPGQLARRRPVPRAAERPSRPARPLLRLSDERRSSIRRGRPSSASDSRRR